MNTSKILFSSSLTDGSKFRKYQYTYGFFMFLLSGFSCFLYISSEDEAISLMDIITHPFNIGVFVLALICTVLYFNINRIKIIGSLDIYEDKIIFQQPTLAIFRLDDIDQFAIQRGSTYHYAYQNNNELVKVGNFIRFHYEKSPHQYEFVIDSKEKNNEFESMIQVLQKNRIKLYYTSI